MLFAFEGAYGTAVLYKKKDDDSLVILKEINLHELNVSERQLAQNEVMNCIQINVLILIYNLTAINAVPVIGPCVLFLHLTTMEMLDNLCVSQTV